jgi:hypothetical protein
MKIYVELIMWEEIKRDCKYPEEDNNDNFIYGLNYTDFENEGDIYEVEWFKSEEERFKKIKEINPIIINN